MAQTNVLITGATGATGGNAVRQLLEKQHALRALAHRADDRSKQLQDIGVEVVFGDLLDFDAVRAAVIGVQRAYFLLSDRPRHRPSDRPVRAGFQGSRRRSYREHVTEIRPQRCKERSRPTALVS